MIMKFSYWLLGFLICINLVSVDTSRLNAQNKLDDGLSQKLSLMQDNDTLRILVLLADQVDIMSLRQSFDSRRIDKAQRLAELLPVLQQKATTTQSALVQVLNGMRGEASEIKSFWLSNAVAVKTTKRRILEIAQRVDVGKVYEDRVCYLESEHNTTSTSILQSSSKASASLKAINAHKLWERGFSGNGSLVMNIDSGVELAHPALTNSWRGNVAGVAWQHAWLDAVTPSSVIPVDRDWGYFQDSDTRIAHGTFTMGLMVGRNSATADTLGVAFGAKWIAACAIDFDPYGTTTYTSYIFSAFEWALNPDGNLNSSDDVPDVINCSFFDPGVETTQCNADAGGYRAFINAFELSGSSVVFAAGNAGPNTQTITAPKNNPEVFCVGATNVPLALSIPTVADFSSRGPSICNPTIIKPEVVAPGQSVISTGIIQPSDDPPLFVNRIGNGTSYAAPHFCGAIALLKEAFPDLTAVEIRNSLFLTATDYGAPGPDNNYGYGFINCEAAYQYILNNTIILDQKFENGARITNSQILRWSGSQYQSLEPGKRIFVTQNTNEILKGDQGVYSGQKYNTWSTEFTQEPDVLNHRMFPVTTPTTDPTTDLTSNFRSTQTGTTLRAELIDAPNLAGGTVGFKDPWLIDFNDAPYGLRNRGMAAPFYDRASPFVPDLTSAYPVQSGSATYKGVFLNQQLPPIGNTYYSARAQSSQTIGGYTGDFLGWAGVGAMPSTPAALETPVVFTAPNAVVSARYKGRLLSSVANATSAGNQRRLANAQGATLYNNVFYLVYESAGKIWLTYSTNGGTSWQSDRFVDEGTRPSLAPRDNGVAVAAR
jgi:hypothetical protein